MATHKKHPVFLRIKTSDNEIICVNPLQLASFRIKEKYEVTNRDKQVIGTGDTIWFYLPAGTYTRYTVGIEITQAEFNYVTSTLLEYLYLNQTEFQAKTAAMEYAKIEEWNKVISEEAEEEKTLTKA